jgi:hypothetical protein
MALSYIPIILNSDTLSDGEAAQILSMVNVASTPAAVALATNSTPRPYRKGKMRCAFLLQDSTGSADDDLTVNLRIRSPFPGDAGQQANRPFVTIQPANAASIAATALFWAGPTGGLPGASAPLVAADFATTFNSKAIPNWGVTIGHADVAGSYGVYVLIEFGASAAN